MWFDTFYEYELNRYMADKVVTFSFYKTIYNGYFLNKS